MGAGQSGVRVAVDAVWPLHSTGTFAADGPADYKQQRGLIVDHSLPNDLFY